MTRRKYLLLFAFAIATLLILWPKHHPDPTQQELGGSAGATPSTAAPVSSASLSPSPEPATSPAQNAPEAASSVQKLKPPRNDELYQEVKKNPHGTPSSLIKFAAQMGKKMETAMASEATAVPFFKELEDCVLDSTEERSPSVQALCLVNAHDVSKKYPTVAERYRALLNHTDSETVKLARAVSDL